MGFTGSGGDGEKKLAEGARVEVRMTEKGLQGSWHPAVVTAVKPGTRVVEYEELVSDDGSRRKLKEMIAVGRGVDGLRASSSSPSSRQFSNNNKSNKKQNKKVAVAVGKRMPRILLRPRPPMLSSVGKASWSKGLWVDVFWKDAWWEGILVEDILSERAGAKAVVYFPDEGGQELCLVKDLRLRQEWDEESGNWSFKGRAELLDLQHPSAFKKGPQFAVKKLNFNDKKQQQQLPFFALADTDHDVVLSSSSSPTAAAKEADINKCRSGLACSCRLERLKRKHCPCPNGGGGGRIAAAAPAPSSPDSSSPAYCISNLLQGLEAAREQREVAVSAAGGDGDDDDDDDDSRMAPLSLAAKEHDDDGNCRWTIQLPAATNKEKKKVAAKMTTKMESHPTPMCCYHGQKEDPPPLLLLPPAVAIVDHHRHHHQAKKSRVSKGRGETPPPEAAITRVSKGRGETAPPQVATRVSRGRGGETAPPLQAARVSKGRGGETAPPAEATAVVIKGHLEKRTPVLVGTAMSLRSHEQQQRVSNAESRGNNISGASTQCVTRGINISGASTQCVTRGNDISGASTKCITTAMTSVGIVPCRPGEDEECMRRTQQQQQQQMSSSMCARSEVHTDDETLEMLMIEHKAQVRKCRIANGKETPPRPRPRPRPLPLEKEENRWSENVRNVMVLRNRQFKPMRRKELEVVESPNEESRGGGGGGGGGDGIEKSCWKRASVIHHCSGGGLEMELHRSKKNRRSSSASEEAAATAAAAMAGGSSGLSSHEEQPSGGKKGVRKGASSSVHERRRKKKGARGGCRMEVLLSEDPALEEDGKNFYTKKNTLSWLIDAEVLRKDQKLRYMYRRKELGVGGWVTPEGVLCGCCNDVVTLSTFETHCGSKLHRPCANIFVEDGRSIAALQMEALKKQMSSVKTSTSSSSSFHKGNRRGGGNLQIVKGSVLDVNDDTCGVCGDGGMLICCDHCPSTFHLKCMELMVVPEEDWYCPNCHCAVCGGSQFNGSHDTFDEMSVLFCDQCEREFHVKCLYARGMPKLEQWPQDTWFCGNSCERIYRGLRGLVGTNNFLGGGFSWTLLRSQDKDPDPETEVDKELLAEQNIKLSIALSVMQECFRPMIDPRTKVDVIAHALYNRGSDINRLNYHGFYTMILEKGDELISVAAIRVHGAVLAEMPLIGTRFQYRRQGMCRRLLHAIEQMLQMVGVETLVLPAVPELLDTWTGAFGFQPMDTFPRQTLIELNLMAFPGTSLLHKSLAGSQVLPPVVAAGEEAKVCGDDTQPLATPKGGLLKGARVTRSTIARVGVIQFVAGKVSDEVLGTEIGSSRTQSGSAPCIEEDGLKTELPQHPCNRFRHDRDIEKESTPPKQEEEDVYRTKVVVATTRYNRKVKTARWVADAMKKLRRHSSTHTHESPPVLTDPCCIGRLSEDKHPTDGEALPVAVQCTVESSGSKLLAETADVKTDPPLLLHASSSSVSEPETLTTTTPSGSKPLVICLKLGNLKQKHKHKKRNKNKKDKEEQQQQQQYSDQKNVKGGEEAAAAQEAVDFCENYHHAGQSIAQQQDSQGDMNMTKTTKNQPSEILLQESLSLSKASSSLLDSSPTSLSLPSTAGQTLDNGLQKVVIMWEGGTAVKTLTLLPPPPPPLTTREGLKSREDVINDQAVVRNDGSFSIVQAVDANYQLLPMLKKRSDCTSSSSSDEMVLYLDGLSSNQNLPTAAAAAEVLLENRVGG